MQMTKLFRPVFLLQCNKKIVIICIVKIADDIKVGVKYGWQDRNSTKNMPKKEKKKEKNCHVILCNFFNERNISC